MITIPRQTTFIGIGLLAVLIAAGTYLTLHHRTRHVTTGHTTNTSRTVATKASPGSTGASPAADSTTTKPSGGAQNNASGTNIPAPTASCTLLSQEVARQIIGDGAQSSVPTDASKLQTADTTISACAWSSGSATVQLVVRTPKDSLGASENSTAFGSERPDGVTPLTGYGQSAYWDPSKQQLDVLGNNSWYIITRNTGTQADAEAVAKLLAPGF